MQTSKGCLWKDPDQIFQSLPLPLCLPHHVLEKIVSENHLRGGCCHVTSVFTVLLALLLRNTVFQQSSIGDRTPLYPPPPQLHLRLSRLAQLSLSPADRAARRRDAGAGILSFLYRSHHRHQIRRKKQTSPTVARTHTSNTQRNTASSEKQNGTKLSSRL